MSRMSIACAVSVGRRPGRHRRDAAKVPQSVGACFELIERDMLKGPWVMGEAYDL